MHIKTTMRYHLTPVRMAITKSLQLINVREGCGKKEPLLHCWWDCKLVQSLWRTVWRFLKKLKIQHYVTQHSTPGYTAEENKNTKLKRYMHPSVHCSITYNSQDIEAT